MDATTDIAQVSQNFLQYQYEVLGIRGFMTSTDVTEICINRPGELYLETRNGWQRVAVPTLTFERARQFCTAVVNESNTGQRITDTDPMVSLTFPTRQRAQFAIPPACAADTVSITIRLPAKHTRTLDQYQQDGFFDHVLEDTQLLSEHDKELLRLRETGMSIADMQRFAQLRAEGNGSVTARLAMLREHRAELGNRIRALRRNARALDDKIDHYERLLDGRSGTEDPR